MFLYNFIQKYFAHFVHFSIDNNTKKMKKNLKKKVIKVTVKLVNIFVQNVADVL